MDLEYVWRGDSLPVSSVASLGPRGELKVRIEGGKMDRFTWDLAYADMFGGMLAGDITFRGTTYSVLKFYRVK